MIESSLLSIPFLAALPVPELRAVARGLELVEYRKLDIIVKEGNGSEDGLYVLVRPTLVVAHPVAVPVGRGAALSGRRLSKFCSRTDGRPPTDPVSPRATGGPRRGRGHVSWLLSWELRGRCRW